MTRTQSGMRWLEYLFLFAGLIALDCYIWINASVAISQAYESWSFNRDLRQLALPAPSPELHPGREIPMVQPEPLSIIGRLEIPRLHLNVMVREGVTNTALRQAVGHVPSTALPGQIGNVAFAGHRDTFFRPLMDIRKDDRITVETPHGTYEYLVDSLQIVSPKDVWVLKASNRPALTLVTCYPFYYVGAAPQRFIVHATQVAEFAGLGS